VTDTEGPSRESAETRERDRPATHRRFDASRRASDPPDQRSLVGYDARAKRIERLPVIELAEVLDEALQRDVPRATSATSPLDAANLVRYRVECQILVACHLVKSPFDVLLPPAL
jgi:hypothetical protein